MKPLPQGPFIKGINAAASPFAQPKGSLPRLSNLLFTERGGLTPCDGSQIINWYNGALQTDVGRFMAVNLFQPLNVARYFLSLVQGIQNLTAPTGLTATDGGSGGSLSPSTTYYYVVTAINAFGGETVASSEVSFTQGATAHKVQLSWTAVINAYGYNVYRGTASGSDFLLSGGGLPVTTNSFLDDGTATVATTFPLLASPQGATETVTYVPPRPYVNGGYYTTVSFTTDGPNPVTVGQAFSISGCTPSSFNNSYPTCTVKSGNTVQYFAAGEGINQSGGGGNLVIAGGTGKLPPTSNSAGQVALIKMPNSGTYPISYSPADVIANFPGSSFPIVGGLPGGTGSGGGSGGGGIVGGVPPTPNGGIVGSTCPIPQILQFQNSGILILGNGYAPQQFTDPSTVTPITSSFVPAFPVWTATTTWNQNSLVVPTTSNGYYYKAIQGGTSGGTEPASWPTTQGNQIADGSIIWQNAGPLNSAAPPPPGAAHGLLYAGSLWVANTYPTDNSNGIDGPCALRMSDVNNINSWNPINAAFIDKDDGTEIQGLAAFTITAQGIPPEGSMVLFKNFATYQVVGVFGASNFAIQRIKSDMGCIAPRSIQFVPGFGIVRLSHLGIACFDGVEDRIISEEIRPYLFNSNDAWTNDITVMDANYNYASQGAQTANPPMYVLAIPIGNSQGTLTRILCYDMVLRCWSVTDLPFSISVLSQVRAEGTDPITMMGGFSDGTLQRWQAGDEEWYTGASSPSLQDVLWNLRTPEAFLQATSTRLYCRNLVVRGQITDTPAVLIVTPSIDGIPKPSITTATLPSTGDFDIFVPIGATGLRFHATIAGTSHAVVRGLDWHLEPKPIKVPLSIG